MKRARECRSLPEGTFIAKASTRRLSLKKYAHGPLFMYLKKETVRSINFILRKIPNILFVFIHITSSQYTLHHHPFFTPLLSNNLIKVDLLS